MNAVVALVAGLLFGVGLLLSGMTNPANVIGFLDITGRWAPALAFTMGGAVVVALPAFAWVRHRGRAVDGNAIDLATRRPVTARLVVGSAVFGLGWGLSGICPGPGLILLTTADVRAFVFFGGLVAGLWLALQWERLAGAKAA
jgi:uncharacterized membrane protein YedE/YeeE